MKEREEKKINNQQQEGESASTREESCVPGRASKRGRQQNSKMTQREGDMQEK